MNKNVQLDQIDQAALLLYQEELKQIQREKSSALLTIQVIDILKNEKLIYESQSLIDFRFSLIQEINRASIRWKEYLERVRSYVIWLHRKEFITKHNSISTLVMVLRERIKELTL